MKRSFHHPVFERRYGLSADSDNNIVAKGKVTIHTSWIIVLLRGVLRLLKVIPPYQGNDIPVTVNFYFDKITNSLTAHRIFYYPDKSPIHFKSYISFAQSNVMIETSEYQLGTTFLWEVSENQLHLRFQSYVLKIKNRLIKLPMKLLLGQCNASETALSDHTFSMTLKFTHPWFGTTYEYFGTFEINDKFKESHDR